MKMALSTMLLLACGVGDVPPDQHQATQRPEVKGVIAARIMFPGGASQKVGDAALKLLASCHYAHVSNKGPMPDWDETLLDCMNTKVYLHIRYPTAETVQTQTGDEEVSVSEMIIVLRGGIWVRWGDEARQYAKYGHDEMVRIQTLLKEAEVVVD